jgi:hypothetical protein
MQMSIKEPFVNNAICRRYGFRNGFHVFNNVGTVISLKGSKQNPNTLPRIGLVAGDERKTLHAF